MPANALRLNNVAMLASASQEAFVGPLDDYTANLVGAWSVARRLLGSYQGPLIRIRRSSDNSEQDIGYDGDGNLDTAAITSFVGANSAFATKVYHQNSGNDLLQTTTGYQPRIVNAGAIETIGSIPALKFDGADDYLFCSTINLDAQGWYIAAKQGSTTNNFLAVLSHPSGAVWTPPFARLLIDTFLGWRQTVEDLSYQVNSFGANTADALRLLEVHNVSGTGNFGVINGVDYAAGGAPITVTDSAENVLIGLSHTSNIGSHNWNGYVGEIFAWGAGYDSSGRAARRAVMNDYWSLY